MRDKIFLDPLKHYLFLFPGAKTPLFCMRCVSLDMCVPLNLICPIALGQAANSEINFAPIINPSTKWHLGGIVKIVIFIYIDLLKSLAMFPKSNP